MEHDAPSGPQLQAMSLLATLRTAAEVCHTMALRRAGMDPSEQEASLSARQHLGETAEDLQHAVTRLRLSLAVERDEESELVHAFEDRMMLARAARSLHLAHQRLLSLYPEADPDVIERARVAQAEAARLAAMDEDGFSEALLLWVEAVNAFARRITEVASGVD